MEVKKALQITSCFFMCHIKQERYEDFCSDYPSRDECYGCPYSWKNEEAMEALDTLINKTEKSKELKENLTLLEPFLRCNSKLGPEICKKYWGGKNELSCEGCPNNYIDDEAWSSIEIMLAVYGIYGQGIKKAAKGDD